MRFGAENNSYLENPFEAAIAKKVEQDKLAQIYYDSQNLKDILTQKEGRCPICTLIPPCKHNVEKLKHDTNFDF